MSVKVSLFTCIQLIISKCWTRWADKIVKRRRDWQVAIGEIVEQETRSRKGWERRIKCCSKRIGSTRLGGWRTVFTSLAVLLSVQKFLNKVLLFRELRDQFQLKFRKPKEFGQVDELKSLYVFLDWLFVCNCFRISSFFQVQFTTVEEL